MAMLSSCDYNYGNNCIEKPHLFEFQDTLWYPGLQDQLNFVIIDSGITDTLQMQKKFKVFDVYNTSNYLECPIYYEKMICKYIDEDKKSELTYIYSQYDPSLSVELKLKNFYYYHFIIDDFKEPNNKANYFKKSNWNVSMTVHADSGLLKLTDKQLTLKLIQ